jgi:hypothetical protein
LPSIIYDELKQALEARTSGDETLNSILTITFEAAADLERAASIRRDSRCARACRNLKQAAERTLYMLEALDTATAARFLKKRLGSLKVGHDLMRGPAICPGI